ncbi:MAG TPA: amidohydrolase family protein [Alphaproteobacteria bacterium]|jgi:predicted TIM-barrel fold metal-dependent hydrolase|nr:amidohydrolase family protein [Alphaproteobacteria bacterium]
MTAHRIDVHHHILPPEYVALVGDARIGPLILAGKTPTWSAELSIEAMERNGIATAITSISAPGLWFGDAQSTRNLCRHCNEFAATIRRDHPGRFGMFASLPLPDVEASLKEIDYAFEALGAEGIGLLTSYGNQYPGDPAFAPVFDELNRRKAVVYFHPTQAPCSQCQPEIPAATLDFPFDTTRAVVSLLFSGTFARCPDIRFIFSHAGGTVPFLAERIGRLAAVPRFKAQVPNGVIPELKRHYYDTALSANEITFAALLKLVAPEHVLFGSDYPFAPEATMTATVKGLQQLGLPAEVLRGIERDNALALFPALTD